MNGYIKIWKQSFDYRGRTRRRDFWLFLLFNFIGSVIASFVESKAGFEISTDGFGIFSFSIIWMTIPPIISAIVRRLHDTNRNGWWILLVLIPYLGWLTLVIMMFLKGNSGNNNYGTDPKEQNKIVTDNASPPTPHSYRSKIFAAVWLGMGLLVITGHLLPADDHTDDIVDAAHTGNIVEYATKKWRGSMVTYTTDTTGKPPAGAKFIFYNRDKHKFTSRRFGSRRYAKTADEIAVIAVYWITKNKYGEVHVYEQGGQHVKKSHDAYKDYVHIELIDVKTWKCFDSFSASGRFNPTVENPYIRLYQPTDEAVSAIDKTLASYDKVPDAVLKK
jgi:uncharacterized membrane protein YhaH (DUF805 family)